MLEQSTALQRPAAAAEEGEEEAKPAPSCPTFRLLDEALPSLYLSNVSYARTTTFFKSAFLALPLRVPLPSLHIPLPPLHTD